MNRRKVIALLGSAVLAWPFAAHAQQPRVWRVGMLETIAPELNTANLSAFRRGLQELGYVEGRNYVLEYRSADGRAERFPSLAAELVRAQVDLIVTRGTPAAHAARDATSKIPIVMAAVGEALGVVESLARPGGNVTGLSAFTTELAGKRVEFAKELLPGLARVGLLHNMSNPVAQPQWEQTKTAARQLAIEAELLDVRSADDVGRAIDAAADKRIGALLVGTDGVTQENRSLIAELAARNRVPAIYAAKEFIESGGLISYAGSFQELYFRAARFVDRILKGAKPGDLPVEQPTKFEIVINLKAARAIGLSIPDSFLARADEVIE